jgi:thioredoxin reductase
MFDLAILGGGPAGLAAAAYALYARLQVALISPDLGGKVSYPFVLRNMPPADRVWGATLVQEFADNVRDRLENHVADTTELVERTDDGNFRLRLAAGGTIETRSIVVCTGARAQRLFVSGETEYWGRGLSFSALSHAPLFADRTVAIVGGGERALTAARILTPMARHIYFVMIRSQQLSELAAAEQALNSPKIDVFQGWEVQQVVGDEFVTGIDLVGINGEVRQLPVEGVFIQFGLLPNNSAVRDLVTLDHAGHIVIDEHCATSLPGIFAAGDVTDACSEQVAVSVGEGAKAALSAWQYLTRR